MGHIVQARNTKVPVNEITVGDRTHPVLILKMTLIQNL